jgi:hypothetical protein
MFEGKARSLSKSGSPEILLSLLTNIRLGLKVLPLTNTLAYCEILKIMAVKKFYNKRKKKDRKCESSAKMTLMC